MIIKGKEGYYVIGSSRRVHLGGPYKKRVDAERQEIRLGIHKQSLAKSEFGKQTKRR